MLQGIKWVLKHLRIVQYAAVDKDIYSKLLKYNTTQQCSTMAYAVSSKQYSTSLVLEADLPPQTVFEMSHNLTKEGKDYFIKLHYAALLILLQNSNPNKNTNFHCFQALILGQSLDSSHRYQISLHSVWFLEGSCGYFVCISTRDTLFSSVTCKCIQLLEQSQQKDDKKPKLL